jgi:hypothetical protein
MSNTNLNQPSRRPTLLIGYGTYGLEVLRRLLSSTVLRGVLSWEETEGGTDAGGRYIKDLALLWVKDRFRSDSTEADEKRAYEGASLEMMRDLFRQIQPVESSESGLELAEAVDEVVTKQLLSAIVRTASNDTLPLGLDVVVIMQPAAPEMIGHLNRLLELAMKKLANNRNLQRGTQAASTLNFIQIVDFENYWDDSELGKRLRQAMHSSVKSWQKRKHKAKPAFERFYFVDGRTLDAIRDESQRIDEITLFLEFLLFEGQRTEPEFQHLYQSQPNESPIATFGIRLVERSSGLFSRLAAAYFGIGWLDYLVGIENTGFDTEPRELRNKLASYHFPKLEQELGNEELHTLLNDNFSSLEKKLVQLEITDEWPRKMREQYEQTVQQLETQLTAEVHKRVKDITEKRLINLTDDLKAGIQADLHDSREPVTLGAVIREIDNALQELDIPPESSKTLETTVSPVSEREQVLHNATRIYAQYAYFVQERLKIERFKRWWILFSLILTVGLTPVIVDWLGNIPEPDKLDRFLIMAYDTLQMVNNPVGISLLLFFTTWLLGAKLFHRRIHKRLERGREFWTHPEKGRFMSYVRRILQPDGVLRKPSEDFLERLLNDMALSIRTEVRHNLDRVAVNLRERQREILWLREQLRDFLKLHGISVGSQHEDFAPPDTTNVRYSIERVDDLASRLRTNPPTPERFRSTQAEVKPFTGWDKRYSERFLYPLNFIDSLLPLYESLSANENGEDIARQFLAFLKQRGSFNVAFFWPAQEGVPPPQSFCLLPESWTRLSQIMPNLSDMGISGTHIHKSQDESRAYLLQLQMGIDLTCLDNTTP